MAFVGSAEIILILDVLVFIIISVVVLGILYIIFRRLGRVKELEARVARLEQTRDRRTDEK
jgi:uncharacterized protein HemY